MRPAVLALALCSCASAPGEPPSVAQARAVLLKSEQTQAKDRAGELWLRCSPEDAEVWVDGTARGRCGQLAQRGLSLGGGSSGGAARNGLHRVDVKKDGFLPYVTYYDPDGVRAALTIRLRPLGKTEGDAE